MTAEQQGRPTQIIDIVFPGAANHHGTLFGGAGLGLMDKAAFIAASRHAPVDFVTASCERIDFAAPAQVGELVEVTARIERVGRRSIGVVVEMVAEALIAGSRRLCTRGTFNMVAVGARLATLPDSRLPPFTGHDVADDTLRLAELVFPDQTSHYGTLFGGNALAAMGKAAFVAATRHSRCPVVMASAGPASFTHQIRTGEVIELTPRLGSVGRSSMHIAVTLKAEDPLNGTIRTCGEAQFVMVALGKDGRPVPMPPIVAYSQANAPPF